ncbi:MAG: ParA family partition ATPase [Myxococcota bacterium]
MILSYYRAVRSYIVAILNQKGGCGKTTVAMQLAAALAREKLRVLVVDADPQGTAARWSASAPENDLFPADVIGLSIAESKVHQELKKFMGKYDWIIVDCPPAVENKSSQSALLVADLAIIPVIPSPPDLWAAVGIRELITSVASINEGLQSALLPNMCQTNVAISKDALEVMKDFGIPTLKSRLHLRTAYRQSAALGGHVFNLGSKAKPAIKEISSLKREVKRMLAKQEKA